MQHTESPIPSRRPRLRGCVGVAAAALATVGIAIAHPAPSAGQSTGVPSPSLQIPETLATVEDERLRRGAPSWAVEGVPPAVWLLVEAAADTDDQEAAKRLYREAEEEARRAAEATPDAVGTRFALAVVLGLRADIEGGRTKVRAASALHQELEAVLAVEPDHARARHMLGRLHAGVMRMNGVVRWVATRLLGGEVLSQASWGEAERHLTFAENEDPAMLDHHLQLANLYRDTGRPDQARAELEHVFEREPASALEKAVWAEALVLRQALTDGG